MVRLAEITTSNVGGGVGPVLPALVTSKGFAECVGQIIIAASFYLIHAY